MNIKKLLSLLAITSLLTSLAACQDGYFENLGKKADDASQKVSDAAHNRGPAQKAGNRVDKNLS